MLKDHLIWTEDGLREAVSCSFSMASVLRHLKMCVAGGNYGTLYKYIKIYNIDISHFDPFHYTKVTTNRKLIPLEKILVKNSTYSNNGNIKVRMLSKGLLENKCYICGQLPFHNDKPLVLQLDHINGVNSDHRKENLRLLCPNCHTQTTTYGSKRRIKLDI
jgi:hypothetical protein